MHMQAQNDFGLSGEIASAPRCAFQNLNPSFQFDGSAPFANNCMLSPPILSTNEHSGIQQVRCEVREGMVAVSSSVFKQILLEDFCETTVLHRASPVGVL